MADHVVGALSLHCKKFQKILSGGNDTGSGPIEIFLPPPPPRGRLNKLEISPYGTLHRVRPSPLDLPPYCDLYAT